LKEVKLALTLHEDVVINPGHLLSVVRRRFRQKCQLFVDFSTREVRTSSLYFKTEDHATLKNKLSRSTMQMGTGCFCITHHSLGEQLASASAQKKI
jgi:hypothetical protein